MKLPDDFIAEAQAAAGLAVLDATAKAAPDLVSEILEEKGVQRWLGWSAEARGLDRWIASG